MAVITQNYDIDLKATGRFPVVKMSQFDTGTRTIVFTVYDGYGLAKIDDGMVARVDGTRSDGVEFSQSCTVSTGSKVSFTISQEMTKTAGKHPAELVLFDASGNPIGTQNFIIDVEPAPMNRATAASPDDRTLYDQFTQSIEDKFNSLSASMTGTVDDISALIGASSKQIVVYSGNVEINNGVVNSIAVRVTYDPITALVHCWINGTFQPKSTTNNPYRLCEIPIEYCPSEDDFAFAPYTYVISQDNIYELVSGDSSPAANKITYSLLQKDDGEESSYLQFAIGAVARVDALYEISLNATWYARGGKYMGVTPIHTGSNTITVGTTTTGAPGTQASVVNSGTAKDVVLDFTIPRGGGGNTNDVRLLVFGDSWTAYYSQYLPSRIAAKLHASWWKCYGVYGAKISGIAGQIAKAGKDTSFDNSTVTHIVIVGGTNNIFDPGNGSDIGTLFTETQQIIDNLNKYFPHAVTHYFPDNSRTSNGGRNYGYARIIERFRQNSDVAVHTDTLWLLSYNNFEFYRTDAENRENLQHLKSNGYDWLAGYIVGCIRGGDGTGATLATTTNCDFLYHNDFVDGTTGATGTAYAGNLITGSYNNIQLNFTYKTGGMVHCSARFRALSWSGGSTAPASQRYAVLDVNTYPTSADCDKWKYAQYLTNLFQPRAVVVGTGAVTLGDDLLATNNLYSVVGTLSADKYGSIRIRCVVDKGNTTENWRNFQNISIDFPPFRIF